MKWLLLLVLISCDDDIEPKKVNVSVKLFHSIISQSEDVDWWLAGGTIPESTNYTVYDPLAASSESNALINLANPGTRDASTTGTAPSWASGSGWTFNSSEWLSMSHKFISSSTLVIWIEDALTGVTYAFGNTKMYIATNLSGTGCRIYTNGSVTHTKVVGSIIGVRAGLGAYFNGQKYSNIPSLVAGTDYDVYLGARNNGTSASSPFTGRILRVAMYDFQLSDAQMDALWLSMKDYQLPNIDSYSSQILALNPIAYYPCNQKYGGWMLDEINGATQVINVPYITPGQSGLNGYSIRGGGGTVADVNKQFISFQSEFQTRTSFNPDEFSMSFNLKNNNSDVQGRIAQIWTNTGGATEYIAPEMRSGLFSIYHKENGVTWNTSPSVSLPNDTWCKIVVYNSKSSGKSGFYIDGTHYEFTRTGTGFLDTTLADDFPVIAQQMDGYFQHVAFYNYVLNQTQVNSLL